MTNYKEIIRLHSLGLNKTRIAESCGCARSTVITALHKAEENGLSWNAVKNLSSEEVTRKLYPATSMGQRYSMPDYEWVHKEMQKSGVTLSLLWVEYCERCRQNGELPYKSTQFNKYYADYVHKTKATMHLEHKPSEGASRAATVFQRLVSAGKRLLRVIEHNEGGANKDLAKFADQINALCDKWDR